MSTPVNRSRSARSRPYHHGDLRNGLVAAALELVAERGPRGFTLTETARRAGVSAAAPYRHFADKQALLAEVARQGFESLHSALRTAAASSKPEEQLRGVATAYVGFALAHPDQYSVMFGAALDKASHSALLAAGAAAFEVLIEVLVTCQTAGLLAPGDPRVLAAPAWSMVHGLSSLAIDGALRSTGITMPVEQIAQGFVTLLLGEETPTRRQF